MFWLGIAGWCFFISLAIIWGVGTWMKIKTQNDLALHSLALTLFEPYYVSHRAALTERVLACPNEMSDQDLVFHLIDVMPKLVERRREISKDFAVPDNLLVVIGSVEEIRASGMEA